MDVVFWPVVQVVNFYYLPTSLRLVYVNSMSLIWAIILSYFKHNVSDNLVKGLVLCTLHNLVGGLVLFYVHVGPRARGEEFCAQYSHMYTHVHESCVSRTSRASMLISSASN